MKALIQRVSAACVTVDGNITGQIEQGLLVLLAVEQGDTEAQLQKLVHKVCHYRVFSDQHGKMNLNVQQAGGSLLIVSQFTLAADTSSGLRPSFTPAALPDIAQALYLKFIEACRMLGLTVETGQFGAEMQVSLINNGPVTFMLES